ncbi:uncharacterized protein LOC129741391 [Uranotaenia lowii]|uniref:uncharacterized protein LOC129741391 n=1 Tax=Uranotaenia lowii TaxID=190385 RepID=UPI002479D967|nr:uncharacterized protein LOC129741391 [Uranotaenia lowii]
MLDKKMQDTTNKHHQSSTQSRRQQTHSVVGRRSSSSERLHQKQQQQQAHQHRSQPSTPTATNGNVIPTSVGSIETGTCLPVLLGTGSHPYIVQPFAAEHHIAAPQIPTAANHPFVAALPPLPPGKSPREAFFPLIGSGTNPPVTGGGRGHIPTTGIGVGSTGAGQPPPVSFSLYKTINTVIKSSRKIIVRVCEVTNVKTKLKMFNLYSTMNKRNGAEEKEARVMETTGHDRFCQERPSRSSYRRKKKKMRRAQSAAEFNEPRTEVTVSAASKRMLFRGRSVSSDHDNNSESEHSERSPLVSAKLDSLAKLLFSRNLLQDGNGSSSKDNESPTRFLFYQKTKKCQLNPPPKVNLPLVFVKPLLLHLYTLLYTYRPLYICSVPSLKTFTLLLVNVTYKLHLDVIHSYLCFPFKKKIFSSFLSSFIVVVLPIHHDYKFLICFSDSKFCEKESGLAL